MKIKMSTVFLKLQGSVSDELPVRDENDDEKGIAILFILWYNKSIGETKYTFPSYPRGQNTQVKKYRKNQRKS